MWGKNVSPLAPVLQTDPRAEGAIYSGAGVVQDGKIITSGSCMALEWAWGGKNKTVELTKTFIAAIGAK